MRRRKRVLIVIAILLVIATLIAVLSVAGLILTGYAQGTFSMAPTLPGCNGRHLDEYFTYRFRDPHRGEIVLFHARGEIGGTITPDPSARQLGVTKRVIVVPRDTLAGRRGRLFVAGQAAAEIPTEPFPSVLLGKGQYFV